MTIAVKLLNDEIKKISSTNTLLDMMLEFEGVLENIDLYAYANWEQGEILEGPVIDRHYVTVKLMYPEKKMPDPAGAKRLFSKDCLVKYHKDELISPVRVRSFDDVITEIRPDGTTRQRAKTKTEPVWVVEIKMPRRYVDEFSTEIIQSDEDSYIDTESLNTEQQAAAEQQMTGNAEQPENTAGIPGEL